MKRRVLAVLLALVMSLGLMTTAAAANGEEKSDVGETVTTEDGLFTITNVVEQVTYTHQDSETGKFVGKTVYVVSMPGASIQMHSEYGSEEYYRVEDGEIFLWYGSAPFENNMWDIPSGEENPYFVNGFGDLYVASALAKRDAPDENDSQWDVLGTVLIGYANPAAPAEKPAAPAEKPAVPAEQPAAPAGTAAAVPTASTVLVNGANTSFDAYNIDGNNYFKLRDLAYVLSGTEKQFSVGWDGGANAISLTSGESYTAVGGEMAAGSAGTQNAVLSTSKIIVNGQEVSLTAYNIGGNNYFKLRDVGSVFDFGIGWDAASSTITIDTSTGYSA